MPLACQRVQECNDCTKPFELEFPNNLQPLAKHVCCLTNSDSFSLGTIHCLPYSTAPSDQPEREMPGGDLHLHIVLKVILDTPGCNVCSQIPHIYSQLT